MEATRRVATVTIVLEAPSLPPPGGRMGKAESDAWRATCEHLDEAQRRATLEVLEGLVRDIRQRVPTAKVTTHDNWRGLQEG